MNHARHIIIGGIAVAAFVAGVFAAHAAGPTAFVSWRAATYTPPGYSGKALPTAGSSVAASLEVLVGGRPANLSRQTVYWYLNNKLVQGGAGAQAATFTTPPDAPTTLLLRAELPGYTGGSLSAAVKIPVVLPKAVIAPVPAGNSVPSSYTLYGFPYFFNVTDPSGLSFAWTVNDASPSSADNPSQLDLAVDPSTPAGSPLTVGLTVANPLQTLEAAAASLALTYHP